METVTYSKSGEQRRALGWKVAGFVHTVLAGSCIPGARSGEADIALQMLLWY